MTIYRIKLKDGTYREISVAAFRKVFPSAGGNFQDRLKQIREFCKDAVDWEMVDEYIYKKK